MLAYASVLLRNKAADLCQAFSTGKLISLRQNSYHHSLYCTIMSPFHISSLEILHM